MDSTKQSIRQAMRRRRQALSAAERQAAAAAIEVAVRGFAPFWQADVILAYVASDGEVDTAWLLELAESAGRKLYLPRVRGDRLEFAYYRPTEALPVGRFGIPEPTGAPLRLTGHESIVAFVPVVAWDAAGGRMGRGGGFYDRALRELRPAACVAGLAYGWQQHAALPLDPWDVRLDYVITERAVLRCSPGRSPVATGKENVTDNGLVDGAVCGGSARHRIGVRAGLPPAPADSGAGACHAGNGGPRVARSTGGS
jgi:5-formyltetrahydrofolate cyclo-ligase